MAKKKIAKKKIAKKKKVVGKNGKKKSGKNIGAKTYTLEELSRYKIVLHDHANKQAFVGTFSAITLDDWIIGDLAAAGIFEKIKDPSQLEIPGILKTPDEDSEELAGGKRGDDN